MEFGGRSIRFGRTDFALAGLAAIRPLVGPALALENIVAPRRLFGFESKRQPLLGRAAFARRVAESFAASACLVGPSLLVGVVGYRCFEGMSGIDAFANASMILSGMGPLGTLQTWAGKLFAGCYALFSGLLLIVATGIILAPVVHRVLHQFHVEADRHDWVPPKRQRPGARVTAGAPAACRCR